jgi:transposase
MTPAGLTVLLATAPVDMRRSFEGLTSWVREVLGRDAGAERVMYVFVNRKRDMAKVLWRDATGWCLLAKRLDEREVLLPDDIPAGASSLAIDARALAVLLDGAVPRRRETARDIARAARDAVARGPHSTNETTITETTAPY